MVECEEGTAIFVSTGKEFAIVTDDGGRDCGRVARMTATPGHRCCGRGRQRAGVGGTVQVCGSRIQ